MPDVATVTVKTQQRKPNGKTNAKQPAPATQGRRRNRNRGGRRNALRNDWLSLLSDPFGAGTVAVPDQFVAPSYKVRCRKYTSLIPATQTGGSNLSRAVMIITPTLSADCISTCTTDSAANPPTTSDLDASWSTQTFTNYSVTCPPAVAAASNVSTRYQYRPVALGVRLVYQGAEVDRSGEVAIGLVPMRMAAAARRAQGTVIDNPMSYTEFCARLIRPSFLRTYDGVLEYRWMPSGAPAYRHLLTQSTGAASNLNAANFVDSLTTNWEEGQYAIAIWASQPTATAAGFDVEVVAHFEIIAENPEFMAGEPSASLYEPGKLATALNLVQSLPLLTRNPNVEGRAIPQGGRMMGGNIAAANQRTWGFSDLLDWRFDGQFDAGRALGNAASVASLLRAFR